MMKRRRSIQSFSSAIPLRSVLDLRLLHGLPLHVGRNVCAAAFERHDVIDNVALASSRVAGPSHEVISRGSAASYFAVATAESDG